MCPESLPSGDSSNALSLTKARTLSGVVMSSSTGDSIMNNSSKSSTNVLS